MKKIKVIMDKVEVCQYDASVLKNVESFNILTCFRLFREKNGYADENKFCFDVDWDNYIGHIYEFILKEVEI